MMPEFLVADIFDSIRVFYQSAKIPMGIKGDPLVTNLFHMPR
jgi:hypothetical protein